MILTYLCPHEAEQHVRSGDPIELGSSGIFFVLKSCDVCESDRGETHINDFHVRSGEVIEEGSVQYHGQRLFSVPTY